MPLPNSTPQTRDMLLMSGSDAANRGTRRAASSSRAALGREKPIRNATVSGANPRRHVCNQIDNEVMAFVDEMT
eukprot:976981-Rhodomonas_salina.3